MITHEQGEEFLLTSHNNSRSSLQMNACLIKEPGKVVLADLPTPTPKHGEVLVRFQAGGICGTDLEKIQGGYGPGGILGHEVSGIVEQVGEGVTIVKPGDRVVPHHHVPCYSCELCSRGDYTMCDAFRKTNFDPCGLAEFFLVPEANVSRGAVIPLPSELTYEEGALIEPAACCIRALRAAWASQSESVLIVGLGPAGLTQLQLLRHERTPMILGSDTIEARREMALKMGAHLVLDPTRQDVPNTVLRETRNGVDLAIVSTGNPRAVGQALSSVRKGGTVLLFGAPAQGASFELDVSRLFSRQVSIVTSYSCVEGDIQEAIRITAARGIDLHGLISHRFRLAESPSALRFAATSRDAVKTIITV